MTHWAYYNDFDPFAAEWLKELIKAGLIAPGYVDNRSIEDVSPDDLREFTQVHMFAGIGVWSLALRNSGWSDDRPVWTGSCPCQPLSAAGKGLGFDDERHLWPAFYYLIRECRPDVVFGEQVASKIALSWLDLVQTNMEDENYAFGAVDTCASGFGAPHWRQRLYWLAYTSYQQRDRTGIGGTGGRSVCSDRRTISRLDNNNNTGPQGYTGYGDDIYQPGWIDTQPSGPASEASLSSGLEYPNRSRAGSITGNHSENGKDSVGELRAKNSTDISCRTSLVSRLADTYGRDTGTKWEQCRGQQRQFSDHNESDAGDYRAGPTNGHWGDVDWLRCRDDKWRPVKPGTFPLVNGGTFRNRVGLLRGAGNAINLAQAEEFIKAYLYAELATSF